MRLAFKPDKPLALTEVPDEFWAVQVTAVSSKDALEAYAIKHNLKGMSAARVGVDERLFFVLLLGIYETRANAESAVQQLPSTFSGMQPWVRSLASLKRAMRQGDRIAGNAPP